jgi:hypothetical protein
MADTENAERNEHTEDNVICETGVEKIINQPSPQPQSREKVFITFGGPYPHYHQRVNKLCNQAKIIHPFFTKVKGFTEEDLRRDDDFWKPHGDFIESNPRGYGFWMWKPYIIKKTLDSMNENDVLFYMDAGCHLNLNGKSVHRLNEYVNMIDNSMFGILSFQLNHPEYKYTKRATFEQVNKNGNHFNSRQCMATVIILRKNAHTRLLIDEWVYYSQKYELINDDRDNEIKQFSDHRHDQSIYSLLVKKHGSVKIPDETFFHPHWRTQGADFPIWVLRNIGGGGGR